MNSIENMDKFLTVIVQTSPLPSHPSTALLEALFRSFDRVESLNECNIIILCDGCVKEPPSGHIEIIEDAEKVNIRTEKGNKTKTKTNYKHGTVSHETANNYQLHLELLQQQMDKQETPFTPLRNGSIRLLKLPYRHGSAKAIAAAFEILSIDTPYVLIAQHDNFFVRDVHYLQQLIQYMEIEETKSWLQCVHFPSTATLNYAQKVQRRYSLDLERFCKGCDDQPQMQGDFIPLIFWYGRTHIARTSYYTEKILSPPWHRISCGDHLEEIWGTKQLNEIVELQKLKEDDALFEAQFKHLHAKYGNYVFFENSGNEQQQEEVLYHVSGRKVHAANVTPADNTVHTPAVVGNINSDEKATFDPQKHSFTTARRAMAVVPGLTFAPQADGQPKNFKPQSKFRQRCFHCGEKGKYFLWAILFFAIRGLTN